MSGSPAEPHKPLRFRDVVELGEDRVAQDGGGPVAEGPPHIRAGQSAKDPRRRQVRAQRLGDARVLDLHRHIGAVPRPRAVDLPQGRGGERLVLPGGKHLLRRRAEILADDPPDRLAIDPRGVIPELPQRRARVGVGHAPRPELVAHQLGELRHAPFQLAAGAGQLARLRRLRLVARGLRLGIGGQYSARAGHQTAHRRAGERGEAIALAGHAQ
jgi:hypothetical protein